MAGAVAIILAAGRGERMGGAVPDKVLARIGGRTVLEHSLHAFIAAGVVERFVLVYRDAAQCRALEPLLARRAFRSCLVAWVRGGHERQDSVARALRFLERWKDATHVFIHDGGRPLVQAAALRELDRVMRRDRAACLAHRVTDTIKLVPGSGEAGPLRLRTLDRDRLWAMETPQAFELALIAAAYRRIQREGMRITDDTSALERTSRHRVTLVENTRPNPKITRPADLAFIAALLRSSRAKGLPRA